MHLQYFLMCLEAGSINDCEVLLVLLGMLSKLEFCDQILKPDLSDILTCATCAVIVTIMCMLTRVP